MDQESLFAIIKLLAGTIVVAGGALIAVVTWIVIQAYKKTETIEQVLHERAAAIEGTFTEQFRQFGKQLTDVRELLKDEIHKMDSRVSKLEGWRDGMTRPPIMPTKLGDD